MNAMIGVKRKLQDLECIMYNVHAVADTGEFGGGGPTSICSEPNASQDHSA